MVEVQSIPSTMVKLRSSLTSAPGHGTGRRASSISSIPQHDDLEIVKPFMPAPVRRRTVTSKPSDSGKIPEEFDDAELNDMQFVQLSVKSFRGGHPYRVSRGDTTSAQPAPALFTHAGPKAKGQKQSPLHGVGFGNSWSAGSCFRKLFRTKKVFTDGISKSRVPGDNVIFVGQDPGGPVNALVELDEDSMDDRRRSSIISHETGESRLSAHRSSLRRSSTLGFKSSKEAASAFNAVLAAEYQEELVKRASLSTNDSTSTAHVRRSIRTSQTVPLTYDEFYHSTKTPEGPSATAMAWTPLSNTGGADADLADMRIDPSNLLDDKRDLLKFMKHYHVIQPAANWVRHLTVLMTDTVLHAHALVYLGESLAQSKDFMQKFMDEVYNSNLTVSEYSFGSSDSTLAKNRRSRAIEKFVGNNTRFLVTNPAHSFQLGEPFVTLIVHMDTETNDPLEYGIRMSPVPLKYAHDALSVLFLEPSDTSILPDIQKEFGVQVKEIPFDVPEISHAPKRSWSKISSMLSANRFGGF